jgi:protein-tyrosine phosphatase
MGLWICFVCTGNICRSPMAEVVLRHQALSRRLADGLVIESAGVAADVGFDIDRRARKALERRGYGSVSHKARQFEPRWLETIDLVVAMDQGHVRWLEKRAPAASRADVRLLLSYLSAPGTPAGSLEIADPYYGNEAAFESSLDLIEAGCAALIEEVAPTLGR